MARELDLDMILNEEMDSRLLLEGPDQDGDYVLESSGNSCPCGVMYLKRDELCGLAMHIWQHLIDTRDEAGMPDHFYKWREGGSL